MRRSPAAKPADDAERPLVLIVDDDPEIRAALSDLMRSVDLDVRCFALPRELLEAELPDRPSCLVLDVQLPDSSGLQLQSQLATQSNAPPIVFLTGYGDIAMSVEAMKAGAIDFLTKPVRPQSLLDAVTAGIKRDVARRNTVRRAQLHLERLATLTDRQRQVFREIAHGRMNKQVAFDLGICEATVKLHRANIMRKLEVNSLSDLVRTWDSLPDELRPTGKREMRAA